MWLFGFLVGLVAGGATIWTSRDPLVKWWMGAQKFAQSLEDDAAKIKITLGIK